MEGRETELDRTILEAIKDPLTHLVRNSIDHGVETPEVRTAAGKPAEGTLLLRAFHEGGRVVVEIRDDGAGIDPERVAAKALERGLVSRDQVARMTEREHSGAHLPARLLHRGRGHERLRPRRRDGCGQDQHRAHRWRSRDQLDSRPRHRLPADHPADAGHRAGADRRLRPVPLRHPAGESARGRLHRQRAGQRRPWSTSPVRRSTACAAGCCRWCASRTSSR